MSLVFTQCITEVSFYKRSFWIYVYLKPNFFFILVFTIRVSSRFPFLQITSSVLRNKKEKELMVPETVSFKKVFHWMKFLVFQGQKFLSLKYFQFSWNLILRYVMKLTLKLVFHKCSERKNSPSSLLSKFSVTSLV